MQKLENILLFLSLLFLPAQLGRHFWPEFAYVYSLPIDYLAPTIYFWDLLVIFLALVWIVSKPQINKVAFNLFLFFILTQVLSLTGGDINLGAGLVRLEQYGISGLFGIYVASQKLSGLVKKIFWPLIIAIFFESVLAIGQFLKGGTLGFWILGERTFSLSTPAIAKFDFYGRQFLRPYATFPHPNVLAGFLVVGVIILSVMKDINYILCLRLRMIILSVATVLAGLTIFLTMSRTAILAGFISAAFLVRRRWLIFIGVLILTLSPILFTRFEALFSYDNLTFLRREALSIEAWHMFQKSPILGVGLNNFIPAQQELVSGPSRFLQPVHNIFLLALAETGILGLLGLLGLLGYPIWGLLRLSPKPYPLNPYILPWAVIIFLGLFDHYFLTLPQGYRLLFLIWGMSLSYFNSSEK